MTLPPMQPLCRDDDGVVRFRANPLVRALYDAARRAGLGLNELAALPFDDDDRAQLAQLLGYSLAGWCELSYVSDDAVCRALDAARDAGLPLPGQE
jgi:hypothetical protein